MEHLLGAHTSINGGVSTSINRAEKLKFSAMQIFTKNNNRWYARPIDIVEIDSFKAKLKKSGIKYVVAHDSYLINLCAADEKLLERSREAFIDELNRCEQLGIPHLNFHPGAHMGQGEEKGIELIAQSLDYVHEKTPEFNVKSMIEMTAGQGTTLGYTFEQVRDIISLVKDPERLCVCIDTAHIFAAGYDFREKKLFRQMMREFDELIGIKKLQCLHINDSKKDLGSRVDRHEHIGKGFIGLEGFRNIMNARQLKKIPKILETPKGKDQKEDLENIEILNSLISN